MCCPFGRIAAILDVLPKLAEAQDPPITEGLVLQVMTEDVMKHAERDRKIRMGLGRYPKVRLGAGRSHARVDDRELGAGLRALAEQVGERDGVRLGLVRTQEKEVFRRPQI